MDKTPNYQLSQWVKSDQVRMEDFNADNAKIDAALKAEADARIAADAAEAQARTALAAQVAKRGNCKIWTTTYTGTGTYGSDKPTSVTFPKLPIFACIIDPGGNMMLLVPGSGDSSFANNRVPLHWSGNTVSWHAYTLESAFGQLNSSGKKYLVVAFYQSDQA